MNKDKHISSSADKQSDSDHDESGGYKLYKRSAITQYDVYMTNEVTGNVSDYQDLLHALEVATGDDVYNIRLSSYGGDCNMGHRLCYAFQTTSAHVQMIVEGNCYSMGAIMALSGDSLIMMPNTFLMFHNYSDMRCGKGGELTKGNEAFNKHSKNNLILLCAPFLTSKEINNVVEDVDVYVHESDKSYPARVKRHFTK